MTKRRRRVGIVPAQAPLVPAALRTRESQGARIRIRTKERRKGKQAALPVRVAVPVTPALAAVTPADLDQEIRKNPPKRRNLPTKRILTNVTMIGK